MAKRSDESEGYIETRGVPKRKGMEGKGRDEGDERPTQADGLKKTI